MRTTKENSLQSSRNAIRTIDNIKLPRFQGTTNKFKIGNVNFEIGWSSRFGGNGAINSINITAKMPNGQTQSGEYQYGANRRYKNSNQALSSLKENLRDRVDYILKQK